MREDARKLACLHCAVLLLLLFVYIPWTSVRTDADASPFRDDAQLDSLFFFFRSILVELGSHAYEISSEDNFAGVKCSDMYHN